MVSVYWEVAVMTSTSVVLLITIGTVTRAVTDAAAPGGRL